MDLRSKATTRLTYAAAIDTAPSFSPDGARICFESDRGGKQQIYVMGAGGGNAQRISFGDGSFDSRVVAARRLLAFTKQSRGQFGIGVMKPDGQGERLLTEGFHNEGPTWAPNGRVLLSSAIRAAMPGRRSIPSTSPAATSSGCPRRVTRRPGLVAAAVVSGFAQEGER